MMNSLIQRSPAVSQPLPHLPIDPAPIIRQGKNNWAKWVGTLVSFAVLAAALWQWRDLDMAAMRGLLPASLAFWVAYLVYYFTGPVSEWLIFRRLWRLPPSGILPLIRKKVSNELVLGYIGEVYFYAWARRHSQLTAAPFGAIKDVAILSALAGNAITLLMLALGAPFLGGLMDLNLGLSQKTLAWSVGFVALTSLIPLLLRRRVLSLPRRELMFVMAVHCARIAIGIGLLALIWHLALPEVALGWWVLLALLRQLVTRLPFVPNKDVVFASLAILLVGQDAEIAGLMALIATLVLATHLALGAVLAVSELVQSGKKEG